MFFTSAMRVALMLAAIFGRSSAEVYCEGATIMSGTCSAAMEDFKREDCVCLKDYMLDVCTSMKQGPLQVEMCQIVNAALISCKCDYACPQC